MERNTSQSAHHLQVYDLTVTATTMKMKWKLLMRMMMRHHRSAIGRGCRLVEDGKEQRNRVLYLETGLILKYGLIQKRVRLHELAVTHAVVKVVVVAMGVDPAQPVVICDRWSRIRR